jgi:type I restriction enzyme S subunit
MSDETRETIPLPRGWVAAPLSVVTQINPRLDRSIESDDVEVNFVPMRAVEAEGGGLVRPERRTYAQVKKGYTAFIAGDVISAKITPCMENGKTTVVPELPGAVCFGSTEFHVLRPEKGIAPAWIANFLLQHDIRRAAQRSMGGAVGQMRVPASFLEFATLPTPPALEQTRIIDTLDELLTDLDAGVASLEAVKTKLALYRASVLKAAVDGSLTADWREQHPNVEPASELLKRILAERRRRWEEEQLRKFKEKEQEPPKNWKAKYREPHPPKSANCAPLPPGWCLASMDQMAWSASYGTSEKCRPNGAGVPVLRIPNVVDGRVALDGLKYAPAEYEETESERVATGDLLVVRTNGSRKLIGRGAVIYEELPAHYSFASYLIRLRLTSLPSLLRWVAVLWQSSNVRTWIETRAATSAGQFNISLGVLQTLSVALAPAEEQVKIADDVDAHCSVIEHLEADIGTKLISAKALRQSILRHAFTGQLVPQDPNDEPASELLKRIAAERERRARETATAKRTKTISTKTGSRRTGLATKKAARA